MRKAATEAPYLSVVATARNDDHGGNPLYRMQLFVNGLIAQCDRYRLPAELVLVEWNPPDDRPRLADALTWPAGDGYCNVRIVEVPPELHARLEYSDRLPLFQMIGKNVGIRRARGEFILATNIDILLSDGLMEYLAKRSLRAGFVYRVDRLDVPAEIDPEWPIEEQLAWCEREIIRTNRREGTLDLRDGTFYRVGTPFSLMPWLRNAPRGRRLVASRFGRAVGLRHLAYDRPAPHEGAFSRVQDSALAHDISKVSLWRGSVATVDVCRYVGNRTYAGVYWFVAGFNDPRLVPARISRRLRLIAAAIPSARPAADEAIPASTRERLRAATMLPAAAARESTALVRRKTKSVEEVWRILRSRLPLHTNASGDFTLMSRGDWETTGGYLEFEMYSMHIDGIHLYTSHYLGVRERFLPFPVYHVEHGGGFRPEAKGDDSLDSTLARSAIPQISNDQLRGYTLEMYSTRKPIPFDQPNWGFVRDDLPETNPVSDCEEASTRAHAQPREPRWRMTVE